ncbi:MAG: hypothetical protein ABR977_06515 [Candidatus Dormibacteria bacterium]|jgi:hypothetical protein
MSDETVVGVVEQGEANPLGPPEEGGAGTDESADDEPDESEADEGEVGI